MKRSAQIPPNDKEPKENRRSVGTSGATENYEMWFTRYLEEGKLAADVGGVIPAEYDKAHSTLTLNEKPLPNRGEVYLGGLYKKCTEKLFDGGVSYVGPIHVNYVQSNEEIPSYEAFAVPQKKDSKIDKGEYARKHPEFVEVYSLSQQKLTTISNPNRTSTSEKDDYLVFDPGHGVDHAFTITYKGSNSTHDVRNFTPQNLYYNRSIRNPLAKAIHSRGNTYKEIAIYPEDPLPIIRSFEKETTQVPLPVGFVFVELNHGSFHNAYYFPNLINFKQLLSRSGLLEKKNVWQQLATHFQIPKEIVDDIWGHEEITDGEKLRSALRLSEHVGYRSLSGRYDILSGKKRWPSSAKAALIRTAAIYRMERAAEYDLSVENMITIASMFNSKFIYLEFNGTLYVPALAEYWTKRAIEELERKNFPPEDIFHFLNAEDDLPQDSAKISSSLVEKLEDQLKKIPQVGPIVELLVYFDNKENEKNFRWWSGFLSQALQNQQIGKTCILKKGYADELKQLLRVDNISNIVFDFPITDSNSNNIMAVFKVLALREHNPTFIEFTDIEPTIVNKIFYFLEQGFIDNEGFLEKGKQIYLDIRRTTLKFPQYDRNAIKGYIENFGSISGAGLTILD